MVKVNEKAFALANQLTRKQYEELDNKIASEHGDDRGLAYASTLERTRVFHKAVNLPVANKIVLNPSVSLRELRLRLILEEFLETVKAFGFILVSHGDGEFGVEHIEGSKYDIVEAADGLGDLDVVVNGAMLSLGIPSNEVGYEIYCSNMTKLDEDGNPIINECINWASTHHCETGPESCVLRNPDLPLGKVLKPDHYVKANISAVLLMQAGYYGTEEI